MDINPQITQELLTEIKNQVTRTISMDGVQIKTRKNVFPPKSDHSKTSEGLYEVFGDLKGKVVLDMGTGTGVQAIQAVFNGAKMAVAVDINPEAVACAKENVLLNGFQDKISVIESDLFNNLDRDLKFDLIIANLPITDYPLAGIAEAALYDPGYEIHKRFFREAKYFLAVNGLIIITHINFKGDTDFGEFEKMITSSGYVVQSYKEESYAGYKWRKYQIKSN